VTLSQSFHRGGGRGGPIIDLVRDVVSTGIVLAIAAAPLAGLAQTERASLAGAWTLNQEQSDQPPSGRGEDREGGRRGGYGGGYGGGGGRGGGGFPGRGAGGPGEVDREAMARMRDAMRAVVNPPERLTITETASMIVIVGADGRTTRLSPDGRAVKDENTKIERKTRWEAGKLVTEISGLGPGRMTQTYTVDGERRQLRITVQMQGGRDGQQRSITHVYDAADR
jgi:hypothetical protein